MNDSERCLIRFVCDGDMRNAQKAVKIILDSISSKKDEQFKENMFRKLESKREFIELPYNLQHLLIAEDTEEFPEARFLLRNEEKSITQKIVAIYRASEKLNEMGIPYLPALMLYGQSGCGKTMLSHHSSASSWVRCLRGILMERLSAPPRSYCPDRLSQSPFCEKPICGILRAYSTSG